MVIILCFTSYQEWIRFNDSSIVHLVCRYHITTSGNHRIGTALQHILITVRTDLKTKFILAFMVEAERGRISLFPLSFSVALFLSGPNHVVQSS